MAVRYSGAMVVRVVWDDAAREVHAAPQRGAYKVRVHDGEGGRWSGLVGEPRDSRLAVDCPEAYDAAARVALTFAVHAGAVDDLREYDLDTSRVVIRRKRALAGEPGGFIDNPWLMEPGETVRRT